VGVGDSLEAALTLAGSINAGKWHLIGDGIVLAAADIDYDVIWRHGGSDTNIVHFSHHFEPLTGDQKFDASPFEGDANGDAVPAKSGDLLVLRFSASGPDAGTTNQVFIPDADGANAKGRVPSLILPAR
jgi:hypothetical protein